ncbi:MAG: hypothetical protein CMO47_06805 [Verrucomicrobiales bacterium]|nr:hypothetical protein [Verrucomicrobiales bacterium]
MRGLSFLNKAVKIMAIVAMGFNCAHLVVAQESSSKKGTAEGEQTARSSVDEVSYAAEWGESYQIRAFGQDPLAKVMFSTFADEIRDSFRSSVYRIRPNGPITRGKWTVPIAIELWGEASDVFIGKDVINSLELRDDNRVVAKISVHLHDEFKERPYRLAVIRALLGDLMLAPYGNDPSILEGRDLSAPEWLVYGFDLFMEHREEGLPSAYFKGILQSGQMLKPKELFQLKDPESLDPVSFMVFHSSAGAMVAALLDQPEGDHALRSLLGDLPLSGAQPMSALLRQHFPAFREMDQGIDKWWALQVASFGQQQSFEFMDWDETEHWLSQALMVRWEDEEVTPVPETKSGFLNRFKKIPEATSEGGPGYEGSIEQFPEFIKRDGALQKMDHCFMQLQALKRTGFPLYRQVIDRYCVAIEKLANEKTDGLSAEFKSLLELRATIRNTMTQTSDYLNFFEATRAPKRSEAFDDYSKMRRALEEKPLPRRNDRITRYLDYLELEFR